MTTSIAQRHRFGAMVLVAMLAAGRETRGDAVDLAPPAAENAEDLGGAVEAATVDPPADQQPTHHQTSIIRPASEPGSRLNAFVIAPDGNIIALVDLGSRTGQPADESESAEVSAQPVAAACEVRTFSSEGKHQRLSAWPVSFRAQTMALGPDHCLYVAGSGRMGRYSLEGEELAIADSPQTALIEKDRDALRQAAEGQIEDDKVRRKQQVVSLQQQRDALAARIEKLPDISRRARQLQLDRFDRQIKQLTKERTVEEVMAAITERVKRINAIAASDTEVFMTCSQTKGYGYCVWRMELDFTNPKCIVTGLSGCCGQMDVCCADGDLWVAENSRHRVVRYNREGKRLAAFGKTSRDGVGASFGGCCNPMNLCFDKDGDLLVSESDGHVKHFTAKGEFVGLAGVAHVPPGCKNSAVGVSPDGERIYYIDVRESQILVLSRGDAAAEPDPEALTNRLNGEPRRVQGGTTTFTKGVR